MRLITEHGDMGSLSLDSTQPDGRSVRGHLIDKHPTGISADPSAISDRSTAKEPHHIVFDQIDGHLALHSMSLFKHADPLRSNNDRVSKVRYSLVAICRRPRKEFADITLGAW